MRILFSGPAILVATPTALRYLESGGSASVALPARGSATLVDALPLADGRVAAVFDDKALVIYGKGADGWTADGSVRTCAKKPAALSLLSAIPALVIGETSGDVVAFSTDPGRAESRGVLTHTSSTISALGTSDDGSLLFSGDSDGRVKVTRVADLRLQAVYLGRTAASVTVIGDAGSNLVISGAADGSLSLWSAQTGALLGAASISGAGDAPSLPPPAAHLPRARSAASPSVILAVLGPGSDGRRLVACALAGAPRIDLFAIAPAAEAAGAAAAADTLSHITTVHCAGGVQALSKAPASVAEALLAGAVSPSSAAAVLLVLTNSRLEACAGTLHVEAIDLFAARAAPAASGSALAPAWLHAADAGSAATRALSAIDWGSIAP